MPVEFGLDVILDQPPRWKQEVLGLLTNQAATTQYGQPGREALMRHGFPLKLLFAPEHGLDTRGPDGAPMPDGIDPVTGLPVKSMYLHSFTPDRKDLETLDRVLFDVPDVGVRFYTYLWSLTYLMEACAAAGKPLVVLDRPNPISGNLELAEGPFMVEENASFIGRWPIPVRHSCTLGELAIFFNEKFRIGVDLEIIPCRGWKRLHFQPEWGTPFIPPSPAIQSFEGSLLYPGLCFLEATNVSEGRGTPDPFTILGAPWLDAGLLAKRLYDLELDEVSMNLIEFIPTAGKYAGTMCKGIQFNIQDRPHFQPVFWGCLVLKIIHDLFPEHFRWEPYPTLANPSGSHHLNRLFGQNNSEELFRQPLPSFLQQLTGLTKVPEWKEQVFNHLIY
ncbi:MAG: exo-beta-N-acetylmuramidase NamZ domain-containing protein [Sediminibacterium sp.]